METETKRPRFVVRRHVKYARRARFSYMWNRHRYSLASINMDSGHLTHHARTLPGAWIGALSIPVREAVTQWWRRVYRDRQWTL